MVKAGFTVRQFDSKAWAFGHYTAFSLHTCMHAKSLQACPTLCNAMDCSLPGSSDHGDSQPYWSWLSCPPPEDLSDPGIEPIPPVAPALQADSLPLSHQGSSLYIMSQQIVGFNLGWGGCFLAGFLLYGISHFLYIPCFNIFHQMLLAGECPRSLP